MFDAFRLAIIFKLSLPNSNNIYGLTNAILCSFFCHHINRPVMNILRMSETGKLKLNLNESGLQVLYRMQEGLPENG